jgi:hypothetical protein
MSKQKAAGATIAIVVGLALTGAGIANGAPTSSPSGASRSATTWAPAGSVGTDALVKGAVTAPKIATGAVDTFGIKDKSIGGWDVLSNTLPWEALQSSIRQRITAADVSLPNSIRSSDQIAPKTVDETDLSDTVTAKLGALPLAKSFMTNGPTKIAKIGGSFATNATVLGTVNLQAGTYLANTTVVFDREDATLPNGDPNPDYATPITDTYPQIALRYPDANGDAGTIMGVPISKAGFVELTQSTSKGFTLAEPTTITVYGFGYNEDRSGFGANQISADVLTQFFALR